jgi:hypothetical protein
MDNSPAALKGSIMALQLYGGLTMDVRFKDVQASRGGTRHIRNILQLLSRTSGAGGQGRSSR